MEELMRKIVPIAIVLFAILALSGCASMLKAMGGVSKDELAAVNQQVSAISTKLDTKASTSQLDEIRATLAQLETIKADLAAMKADLALVKATTDELAKTKASVDALYEQVSKLTDETLLKLASIIQQSLAPGSAAAPAAAPAAVPASDASAVK
jgi:polyhydroxyalkanoate synthesis regulator phasin